MKAPTQFRQSLFLLRTLFCILLAILLFMLLCPLICSSKNPTDDPTAPNDTLTTKKSKLTLLPAVYVTPETGLALGGLSMLTFRFKGEKPSSQASQVQFAAIYTAKQQMLLYFPFQLFWKEENYRAYGEVGYYKYSYNYYGVGNDHEDGFVETYNVNFPRIRLNVLKQWRPNFYGGIRYWFDQYGVKVDDLDTEGRLVSGQYGGRGGNVSGLGLVNLWDTRDNIFYPKKGIFVESLLFFNRKAFGSDFNFTRFSVDVTKYFSFTSSKKHILALNLYNEIIAGNPPFNEMALIGGSKRGRGYYQGRFREKNLSMLQAEYRFPIIWRFSGAVFGTYAGVANQINKLQIRNFHYAYGAGLRFTINTQENVNIRVDYAFGEHDPTTDKRSSGLYFTIGEAF